MISEELKKNAFDSMVESDEELALKTLEDAIQMNADLTELLTLGYSAGMQELGELFSQGESFLPDLMYTSEIMRQVSEKIEEILLKKGKSANSKGKMIMVTVEGDVHDIGKGICCSLLKAKGIEVIDLGRDIPAEDIVNKAEELGVNIIGLSALLTTTMVNQESVIQILKERGIRDKYKVLVGGSPVTQRWAEKIGADAYTEDAAECAEKAYSLIA